MLARELMTEDVVVVAPDTPATEVARRLLDHSISAAPVVDETGAPVGMVSEGDLIGRDETARDARRDWWLAALAEGSFADADVVKSASIHDITAADVMATPVITVVEDTDAAEIARLLSSYRIKRVPVLRKGKIVGIVSRADLLRAVSATPAPEAATKPRNLIAEAFENIEKRFQEGRHSASEETGRYAERRGEEKLSAADFRSLMVDFEREESHRHEEEREAAKEQRQEKVKDLIDHHIPDEKWRALVHRARQAAMHGEKRFMILRFPAQLCSDNGRAINITEPDWPSTLRGEAAELYLRWEHDLRPQGFHISAEILDFPGGMPGDIGLFLSWG
jgi:CBS domain-containing protein